MTATPSLSFGAQVGQRVRSHRQAAGLSQVALAEKARMSAWELNRLENGRKPRGPGTETLLRLAAALDREVNDLVGRSRAGGSRARGRRSRRVVMDRNVSQPTPHK